MNEVKDGPLVRKCIDKSNTLKPSENQISFPLNGLLPYSPLHPFPHFSHFLPNSGSFLLTSTAPISAHLSSYDLREAQTGDPAAKGSSSLPGACCSLLFSFPCNSRGQVRCASKHCNHILNGNETCELNINYSRMEGQSLLVKVWHLFLQTFLKRHSLFPTRVMRGRNYVAAASAVGPGLVTQSFVQGDLDVGPRMYFK